MTIPYIISGGNIAGGTSSSQRMWTAGVTIPATLSSAKPRSGVCVRMKRMKKRHESHGASGVTQLPKENSAKAVPMASQR